MKTSRYSRRDFLKYAGLAGAGSVLLPAGRAARGANQVDPLPTRPFGRTGRNVSILSLGGMFDIASNQLMLQQALRWGLTYWDTADCYRHGKLGSEAGFGKFFQKFPETRSKVFLVSKSDQRDPEGMSKLLARSLERLNTDYIDLYFVHAVRRIDELNQDTRRWAEQQKAAGKIRLFGFSTHHNMEKCLQGAAKLGWIDGIMMTYNYRLMHEDKMRRAVDACLEAGIGLTAMKTQGGGPVKTDSDHELELGGHLLQRGFTPEQAKLKAVWENPQIASICSQMPNMAILMANIAAALDKTSLAAAERRMLQVHANETADAYCAGCTDICEAALAQQVPIGDAMRCLMYARSYHDRGLAEQTFRSIPAPTRRLMAQVDYRPAEKRCPRQLAIGRLMREALDELA